MEDQNSPAFPEQNTPPHPQTVSTESGESVPTQSQEVYQRRENQQDQTQPQPTTQQPVQKPEDIKENSTPPQESVLTQKQDKTKDDGRSRKKSIFPKKLVKIFVTIIVLLAIVAAGLFAYSRINSSGGIGGLLGEKGRIVWWGFRENPAVYNAIIEEYESQNPGVEVVYESQSPQDYRERLTNVLASGNGPDIFEIHSTWIPMFNTYLSPLPSQVMSQEEYQQTFYSVVVDDMTQNGEVLGTPLYYDALTLFVNEDIFSASARVPPETWNDFRPLVAELTQRGQDGLVSQSGSPVGYVENVDYWPEVVGLMFFQNGADFSDFTQDRAASVIRYYRSFATSERSWDTRLPPSIDYFAQGKVAMHFAPSSAAQEIAQMNPNLRFNTVNLPQLPKDNPDIPDVSYATYWTQGVWKQSADKERAWDFLKFLTTRDSLLKMNEERRNSGLLEKPYPRSDMSSLQHTHPIFGSVVRLAPNAQSWYLADHTNDGPSGINSQLKEAFSVAIDEGGSESAMSNLQSEVSRILGQYGAI